MEYPFTRTDVNLVVLRDMLSEALNKPVEILVIPAQSYYEDIMEDTAEPVFVNELVEVETSDGNTLVVPRVRDTGTTRVIGQTPSGRRERVNVSGTLKVLDPETGAPMDVDEQIVAATIAACPISVIPSPGPIVTPLSNNEIEQLRALISN